MLRCFKFLSVAAAFALALCSAALAGERAADFGVVGSDGSKVRLSDFEGTPLIVNFWATWCPPCRAELPAFDKLAAEYDGKVRFMMVDLTDGGRETVDRAKQFIIKEGYTFPVYFDTEYEGASAYAIRAIPTTVVIDANFEIEEVHIGGLDEAALRGYIKRIVK